MFWVQTWMPLLYIVSVFRFHSEILASLNFNKNKFFVPWIGKQPFTEMLFWQFPNIIIYVRIVGKISDQYLNVWLFSNPMDKAPKRRRNTGQICPVLSTRIWTFSPGMENTHTLRCCYGIFTTILTYMIKLENCQNKISVYGCSPIQGNFFCSCWNLMKPGSQRGLSQKVRTIHAKMEVNFFVMQITHLKISIVFPIISPLPVGEIWAHMAGF